MKAHEKCSLAEGSVLNARLNHANAPLRTVSLKVT